MAKNRPSHISKPVYPGGLTAMRKFVKSRLQYPDKALKAKVEGTVTVRYSLDYRGKVIDAKVKKGLGFGCDEEAVRVVKLLRFEVPQDRKKKVRIHQDINIHFKLPKAKSSTALTTPKAPASAPKVPPPNAQSAGSRTMTINYVPATKSGIGGKVVKKEGDKPGGSYIYTITVK